MNPSRRQLLSGAGALATLPAIPSALAQSTPLIQVATFVPEQSVGVAKVIRPWMNSAQQEVGSKARFQGFWGGSLGKDAFKQFDLVRAGVADVAWILPGYHGRQFEDMQMFELPFLFENATEAALVGWQLCEKRLLRGLEDVHLVGFFASEVSNVWMANPLKSLDELKGKKIRSVGAVHAEWLKVMGASAETMDSPEMNEGLQRRTLDGVIQSWSGMRTFKTLPLVRQNQLAPVGVIPFLLLMNRKTFDGLAKDVQDAVMKHGGTTFARSAGAAYEGVGEEIRAGVEKEGRIQLAALSPADKARYAEQAQAVHKWWIQKSPNGEKIYAETLALLKKIRG
jgi:TRAP-type C4-dicarboxylate transport system substrate-binding protein